MQQRDQLGRFLECCNWLLNFSSKSESSLHEFGPRQSPIPLKYEPCAGTKML